MPRYLLYSLRLQSTHPLWHVAAASESSNSAADIQLTFARADSAPSLLEPNPPWLPLREQQGAGWRLSLAAAPDSHDDVLRLYTRRQNDETTVLFGRNGARLTVYCRSPEIAQERYWIELSGWILGSVLGYATSLRCLPTLHGSVVAVDGKAIGLLGASGAGKSTLAAAFVRAGHAMLADDHLVVTGDSHGYRAQPGPPRLRLWPASLPVLPERPEPFPDYADLAGKCYVEPGAGGYCHDSLPLAAVYVLMPRDPACVTVAIQDLAPAAALNALMNQRFCAVPISPSYPRTSLAALSDLARHIPVRLVHRPQGLETLPAVVAAIQKDATENGW